MHARLLLFLAALALQACSSDDDRDFDAVAEARGQERLAAAAPSVAFDPANAVLPFPNDALFAGGDGLTINAPLDEGVAPDDTRDPRVALNAMDGFSTVAPIVAGIDGTLDPDTVVVGETVRVFEVMTDQQGLVTGIGEELGADRVLASAQEGSLVLLPLVPLDGATTHAVVLTDGLADANDPPRPLETTTAYRLASGTTALTGDGVSALEPLRLQTRSLLDALAASDAGFDESEVALSWTFRTQGIREVLQAVEDAAAPSRLVVAPAPGQTSPGGKADILVGVLDVPYYQSAPSEATTEGFEAALSDFWRDANGESVTRFSPQPVVTSTESIPVLMTVPNESSASGGTRPEAGWPVMVFQHGLGRQRTDMLAVADTMADQGFAVIAIDSPVHGLTDEDDPLYGLVTGNPYAPTERTFGIDVVTVVEDAAGNRTVTPGADGEPDPSGEHFVGLRSLLSVRDNFRQTVADLMTLSASLDGLQVAVDADGNTIGGLVDASRKAFLGHSLGAIVGTIFLSYDDTFQSATLAMPAGGLARVLAASPVLSPPINRQLAATGVEPGSADYAQLLSVVQTIVDSGDPINHGRFLAEAATPQVHLIEVVGSGEEFPSDRILPNAVLGAPLSGTEPLARVLGLAPTADDTTGGALVRFSRGNHGSIINPVDADDPAGAAAATAEMQGEVAVFAASQGQLVDIMNPDVIAPVDVTIVPLPPFALPDAGEGDDGGDGG